MKNVSATESLKSKIDAVIKFDESIDDDSYYFNMGMLTAMIKYEEITRSEYEDYSEQLFCLWGRSH